MRALVVSVVVAAVSGGVVVGVPGLAEAAAYACKGADKGVYKLCLYGKSGVTIKGRIFSNAQNGILVKDSSKVTITKNTFKGLRGAKGWAGVHVKGSSRITIKGNSFAGLSNKGNMHGVYMVKTSRSVISGNKFSVISGDPVRLRDASSYNVVSGNTFTRSGTNAMVSEWGKLRPHGSEKCGTGNVVKGNRYGTSLAGGSIALIKWGGKGGGSAGKLSWGNCAKASIKNGGGNKRV